MSDDAEQESTVHPLVNEILTLVDDMLSDREAVIEGLNAEIELVQARFTVLSAIRDSLLPDTEADEADLPLADADTLPVRADIAEETELANQIAAYVLKHGASKPGDIAAALNVHSTKIGRVAARCGSLEKRYITGKGNCIVLKD